MKYNDPGRTGAYIIKHTKTGYIYIGSTNDFYARRCNHESSLLRGKHYNVGLQNAYNNDINITFTFYQTNTRDEAYDLEQKLLLQYKNTNELLNIAFDARNNFLGLPKTQEHKEKLSIARTGKKLSEEHIEKVRIANTGKKRTPEFSEKMRVINIGKKRTPEQNERNRLIQNKRFENEEIRENVRTRVVKSLGHPIIINGIEYESIISATRLTGLNYHHILKNINDINNTNFIRVNS